MNFTRDELLSELKLRLAAYESQCNNAEEENNNSKVRRYKRIIAQYNKSINDIAADRDPSLDSLSDLPIPPGFLSLVSPIHSANQDTTNIPSEESPSSSPSLVTNTSEPPKIAVEDVMLDTENLIENLSQRLEKYMAALQSAESEGVAAKVRRYKRIIKQYNDAIQNAKAGRQVLLAELPNPPGLPPLVPPSSPLPSPQPSPLPTRAHIPPEVVDPNVMIPKRSATAVPAQPHRMLSRAEKQTAILRERQKEYRDAALTAKRSGQISEAKDFLKTSKGFDRLIGASESGLPVDLTTIPPSLCAINNVEETFVLVTDKDFAENPDSDVYDLIKNELQAQIKSCIERSKQMKSSGDVANANRFEQMALGFKQDFNKVCMLQSGGQAVPRFHYEQKTYSAVHCFTDVGLGHVELSIVQAVGLPKVVDSYVGYEFPYPSESPPTGYTPVIKNSDSPNFNFKINFAIDRDNKQCQRMFKRQGQSGIKLELWARGGFLRKDVSMGTVTVKLLPLTSEIMIHDAFDLMNGRRPAAGKLEVKVRVREPLLTKKIETIIEKWLVLE